MRRVAFVLAAVAIVLGGMLLLWPRRLPNVLLISIDTLRADHLSGEGYKRQTSPFLDALAARGTSFENVSVPLPSTDASHASLLTSLHPLHHGILTLAVPLPSGFETLGEAFRRNGYVTLGVVSVFHMGRTYRFDRGFDGFSDSWKVDPPRDTAERRDASSTNRAALELIDTYRRATPRRPFFLFVHYFDVHGPYRHENPAFAATGSPGNGTNGPERMIARYDAGIRYVDEYIRRLYKALDMRDLTKNLIVCITADHGEQLGEHGYDWGHADFYDETVRVPLILTGPGVPVSRVRSPVSSLDIGVSLLHGANLTFQNAVDGQGLRGIVPSRSRGNQTEGARGFLVLGNVRYTRSLRLVEGGWSYVRNLDYFYRNALVPGPDPSGGNANALVEVASSGSEGNTSVFRVPPLSWDAAAVTAEVTPVPSCALELNVYISPGLAYFDHGLAFRSRGQIVFPAGRNDAAELRLGPAACVGRVRMTTAPYAGSALERMGPAPSAISTEVFRGLATLRKQAPGDELYNLNRDPDMRQNLAARTELVGLAGDLAGRTERLFASLREGSRGLGASPLPYTPEEVRKLRNLGYLK